jgi:uncharacterized SAM-binding protein YcdF (DUF218 family)
VFFFFSKILDLLFTPIAWCMILVLLSVPLRTSGSQKPKRQRAFALAGLFVLYVFSLAPLGNSLMGWLESSARDTTKPDETYDAVIFLGGVVESDPAVHEAEAPYNDNVERMHVTFDMLRDNRARYAILSGGTAGGNGLNEANEVKKELVRWGIDPERILVDDAARNTRENAVNTAAIAKEHGLSKLVIVTSAFHMKRAEGCFRAVGLTVDTLPTDYKGAPFFSTVTFAPRSQYLDLSTRAFREMFGRLVYRLNGYSKPSE